MRKYAIITDSCADLPRDLCERLEIDMVTLEVSANGELVSAENESEVKVLYEKLRTKASVSTAAPSIERFEELFGGLLEQGRDILYLGFSSALSATLSSATMALRALSDAYPQRKLYAVDTLCASMGQGLLVYYAAQMRANGADIDTVRDWVEEHKGQIAHWFLVDDLFFLKRGGRVNAATAVVGTLLGVKPILHVDDAGRLIGVSKARGRRAAVDALFERMRETMRKEENQVVFISHGDCAEDAVYLAERIRNETGIADVLIHYIGPAIGAHSGPGTLALFFLARER